jgi:transposase
MPGAYSMDLRERVIAACEARERTRSEIAEQFQISEGTLYDWLRRWRSKQSFAPAAHSGGYASEVDAAVLRELVEDQKDRTLSEYAELYAERTGRRYSPSHLSRVFKERKLVRKRRRYAPRNRSRRRLPPSA